MSALLPAGIDPTGAAALVLLSVFTSALSASVGIGGGVLLLAAMTFVVPIEALVPIHGVVQLGSNLGRVTLLAKDVAFRLIVPFTIGCVLGAVIGGLLVTDLPENLLLLIIGVFVTATTWLKLPPLGRGERGILAAGGLFATILTMFVGATGPFVMMLMRQSGLSHAGLVATTSMGMTIQHALKVSAFATLGFAFGAWVPLIAAMIAAGFVGTFIGARLLKSLPEASLKLSLKIVLTLIGAQLILRAVSDFI
ncbi:sulfite exporter TauE/SafE family protein [Acuticoccus sp. M5D2P5]|uniref:sulfite exporter TauE/SafE family protein n=1 Tax=Acuticoccus kalidii TaxID=2910977 RepID=UPI001F36D660|nr:sulfite exporter TauE/SafE family protein [Acuticoccus kalidii]MCF3933971.1 sulfite exporter TauE/SafE family protein [Acuticoccus kalidii]